MKNKNIKLILIVLAILAIIGIIALILASCNKKQIAAEKTIQLVTNNKVFYPGIFPNQNRILYFSDKGMVSYDYNQKNNVPEKILDNQSSIVYKVNYAPSANGAVLFYSYPSYTITFYDLQTKQEHVLNNNIEDIVWDEKNNQIFYTYLEIPGPGDNSQGKYTINESDYSGKNWQMLTDLTNIPYNFLVAPIYKTNQDGVLFFLPESVGSDKASTLYQLNLSTKEKTIASQEKSIVGKIKFSPDGTKIAHLNSNGELTVQTLENKNSIKFLKVKDISVKNQVVWENDNQHILILKDLDTLLRVDTINAKTQTSSLNRSNVDSTNIIDDAISNLTLSTDNKLLYFTYDDYLYKIAL